MEDRRVANGLTTDILPTTEQVARSTAGPDVRSVGAQRSADHTSGPQVEHEAAPLRPVAHWVQLPDDDGGTRLGMVWEVPDPIPSAVRR